MSEEAAYNPQGQQQQPAVAAPAPAPAAAAPTPTPAPPPPTAATTTTTEPPRQPSPPPPPPPPVVKSDLSRRAVPLGSGASARGTGMLARSHTPTKLGAPSAPAAGGGAGSGGGSLTSAEQSANSAPNAHSNNPLKRLTASTMRHLHLHPAGSATAAADGACAAHYAGSAGGTVPPAAAAAGVSVRQRALGDVLIGNDPNSSVAVPSAAARLYVDMNAEEIGEEAREATRGARLIHPLDPRYRAWWMVTIGAALATGWIEPFRIAFLETRSQGVGSAPSLWLNALSISVLALFCIDIVVSFFVGYYDGDGILVMRHGAVERNYIL